MCSATVDLTARARIRTAALARFGAEGANRVSIRAIAADAGVSPALVLHHFGSKEQLRKECDAYVIAMLRTTNRDRDDAVGDTSWLSNQLELSAPARRYLARTMLDGSEDAAALFDEIVELAAGWLAEGENAGWTHPTADPRARAAVYVAWLLAPLVFGDHVARALRVDDLHTMDATMRYSRAQIEMLSHGVFSDAKALRAWDAIIRDRAAE